MKNEILSIVITNSVNILAPILLGYIASLISKGVNKGIDAKIKTLELEEGNQEWIKFLEQAKIDKEEEASFNEWVKHSIRASQEDAFKSWLNPDVKEKTGQEKLNFAVDYVKKQIENNIKDPEKQSKFFCLIEDKIHATLPVIREQLDKQYYDLKKQYLKSNKSELPNNSRHPDNKNITGIKLYSDGIKG